MLHISYNTGSRALPDKYVLSLGHCEPSGIVHVSVRIYQAKHCLLHYIRITYTLIPGMYKILCCKVNTQYEDLYTVNIDNHFLMQ